MGTYHDGGQICFDRAGGIFIKHGESILKAHAMVVWDGMLVFGVGEAGTLALPNLVFLDKTRYQDKGGMGGGTAENNTIASLWTSGNYHASDYSRKRITRLEITYYDDSDYVHHATSSGFIIKYRRDNEVLSTSDDNYYSNVTGEHLPKFTTLKAIPYATETGNVHKDREHTVIYDIELSKDARFWQFRITSDYNFMVIGFTVWAEGEALEQDE
jgi:hypothetical protein